MRSSDDYLTDIITRRIIFSPTDECFWAHGWMDTDFAMLMFFFEHEFLEYNEFTMRMCIFILPQMAQMDTDFFTKTLKNTVYIFRAHGLLKIQTKP